MTRLPFLGMLLLFFALPASAQPMTSHGGLFPHKPARVERLQPTHLDNEKPDTLHYQPITKVKNDFAVNSGDEKYGADQEGIDIANGPDGSFLCVWIDHRTWSLAINAQLFDRDGRRVGAMIRISDGDINSWTPPSLTFNSASNEYIVLWAGSRQIFLQRMSAAGQKIGTNMAFADSQEPSKISAAADASGNIFITWTDVDYNRSLRTVNCRLVSQDGTPLTDPWSVNINDDNGISTFRQDESIAIDGAGRCLIVWNNLLHDYPQTQILLQSVNRNGSVYAHPIVVNDSTQLIEYLQPTIASTTDGHFFILWSSAKILYGRIFHPDSGFVTPPFAIAEASSRWDSYIWDPYVVSSNDADQFFVVWNNGTVSGQVFSSRGTPITLPVPLSIPSISGITKGRFNRLLIGYTVYEHFQTDVVFQAFDQSLHALGSSEKAADDDHSAAQLHPVIRCNQFGGSMVVWADRRDGYDDLYGQLFNAGGEPISSNFRINDTTSHVNSDPSIASDRDGNFIVAFAAGDYASRNIRLQKVFSNGMPGGGNIDGGSGLQKNYTLTNFIQSDSAGNALACWWSGMDAPLYCRRFDGALNAAGVVQPIFNAAGASPMNILAVSANHRFNILVLWTDIHPDWFDYRQWNGAVLKAMVIDEKGTIVRDTMVVAVIPQQKRFDHATCRLDDEGNMLFVWTDILIGPSDVTVHAQRWYPQDGVIRTDSSLTYYTYSGAQILKFEKKQSLIAWNTYPRIRSIMLDDVSSQFTPIDLQTAPAVDYEGTTKNHVFSADCYNSLLFTAYQKGAGNRSIDIYANVQFFGRIGGTTSASVDNSMGAYPNPSRQSVSFRYDVSKSTDVQLAVYNILGQKIADLERGSRQPGRYTVQFPTRDLPAGVYFFVFNGMKSVATKFLVVK